MPILKSWLFNIIRDVYPFVGLYVEVLSLRSVPQLIIAIGVSQIEMLRPFVPGHDDMYRHPHQLTFEDLTNPACNFSCDDHPGRDIFLLTDILTCFDVSNGQMLYYVPWAIHIIAPVQPRPFMFTLLKKQFSRIRPTGPVQFLSAVNFEQPIFFRSHYDPNDFCLLNCLSRDIHHFSFPAMRQFNPDNVQEIRNGQNIHPTHVGERYCFEACCMNFVTIVLKGGSAPVCALQSTNDYSIA
jgi:hypothetical protein